MCKNDVWVYHGVVHFSSVGCSSVTIKSRADWGARNPTSSSSVQNPLGMFFVHHTAGGECDSFSTCSSKVRGIQNYHMDTNGTSNSHVLNDPRTFILFDKMLLFL